MLTKILRVLSHFFAEMIPHAKASELEAKMILLTEFAIFFFLTVSLRVGGSPPTSVSSISDSVNKIFSLVNPQYLLSSLGVPAKHHTEVLLFFASAAAGLLLTLILINSAQMLMRRKKRQPSFKSRALEFFPFAMTLYLSHIGLWNLIVYNILFHLVLRENLDLIARAYSGILIVYFISIHALTVIFFNDNTFPAYSQKGVAAAFVSRAMARTPSLLDLISIVSKLILTCCIQLMYSFPGSAEKYLVVNSCLQMVLLGLYDFRLNRKPFYFICELNSLMLTLNSINIFSAFYFVCSIPMNIIDTMTIYSITVMLCFKLLLNRRSHRKLSSLKIPFFGSLWPKGDSSLVEQSIREVYSILIKKGTNIHKLPMNLLSNIVSHGLSCPAESCFSKVTGFHDLASEKDENVSTKQFLLSLRLSGYVKVIISELYEAAIKSYPKSIKLRVDLVNFFTSERKLLPRAIKDLIYIKKFLKKEGNIQESFLIKMCERHMQVHIRQAAFREGDSRINMAELLNLESDYFSMLQLINDFTILYRQLLILLGGDTVDLRDITLQVAVLQQKLAAMENIATRSRGNPRILKIYLIFLKDVRRDDYHASKIATELKTSYNKILLNKRNQKTFFEIYLMYTKNTSLIEISSDSKYPGIIKKVNQGTCKLFGYTVSELEGLNVKILMPSSLAKVHDNYLIDFLKTGKRRILGREQSAYANSKEGCNLNVSLLVKPLYRIAEGLFSYTSFIQPIKRTEDRIITDEYGLIDSLSSGFLAETLFNSDYKQFKLKNLYIQTLAPNLSEYFFAELMKKRGLEFSYEFFEKKDGFDNPRLNIRVNEDGDYATKMYIKRKSQNISVDMSPEGPGDLFEFFRELKVSAKQQITGARSYKICFGIEDVFMKNVHMKVFSVKSFEYLYTKRDRNAPASPSEKSSSRKKTLVLAPQLMQNIKSFAKRAPKNKERPDKKKEKTTMILQERKLIKQNTMEQKAGRSLRRMSSLILQKEVEITNHQMNFMERDGVSSESEHEEEEENSSVNTSSIDEHVSDKRRIRTVQEEYASNSVIIEDECESPTKSRISKDRRNQENKRRDGNVVEDLARIQESIIPMNDKDDGGNKVDAIYESKRQEDINVQKDLHAAITKPYVPYYIKYLKFFLMLKFILFMIYFIVASSKTETGYHSIIYKIANVKETELIFIKLMQLAQETMEGSFSPISISDIEAFSQEIYRKKGSLESSCYNLYCSTNVMILEDGYKPLSLIHAINMLVYKFLHFREGVDPAFIENNLLEVIEKQWGILDKKEDLSSDFTSMRSTGLAVAFSLCSLIILLLMGVNYMAIKCHFYYYQTVELLLAPGAEVYKKLERRLDDEAKRSKSYYTITSISKSSKKLNSKVKSPLKKMAEAKGGTNRRSRKHVRRAKMPLVRIFTFNILFTMVTTTIFILLLQFSSFLDTSIGEHLKQMENCQKMKQLLLAGSLKVENGITNLLTAPPNDSFLFSRQSQDILQEAMENLERVMEGNSFNAEDVRKQIEDLLFAGACKLIMKEKRFFSSEQECQAYNNGLLNKGLKSIVQYLANFFQALQFQRESLTADNVAVTGILLEVFELLSTNIESLLLEDLDSTFHSVIRNTSICAGTSTVFVLSFFLIIKFTFLKKLESDLMQAKENLSILPFSVILKEFRIVNYLKHTTGMTLATKSS